jgi:hypothetical protein
VTDLIDGIPETDGLLNCCEADYPQVVPTRVGSYFNLRRWPPVSQLGREPVAP